MDGHNDKDKHPDPTKHLYYFPEHRLNWEIFRRVNDPYLRNVFTAYTKQTIRVNLFDSIPK